MKKYSTTHRPALFALVLTSLSLVNPLQAMAEVATLDLSSTQHSATANHAGQINVGGSVLQVTEGTQLTQAEKVALYQSNHGGQTLLLGAQGQAIGGTLTVSDRFHPTAGFVIPTGVTVLDTAAALNLTGNLNNSGSILANPSAGAQAAISAANIFNNSGALISTITANVPTNLNLTAINNIVNAGQILSSGNLNLNAGGSIINTLPAGITGAQPVMQAANNLSILTGASSAAAQIVNSGLITALAGNINIASQTPASILVNNTGGSILAQLGSVNVRDSLFTGKYDFILNGGNLSSQVLNINSGNGNAVLEGLNVSSLININAGEAHLNVISPNLSLGTMNLSGDPTFFNSAGSIQVNNAISTLGVDLSIVASGDITSAPTGASISTTSAAGGGGNITIIAGASFTGGTGFNQTSLQNGGNGDTGTTLTVTGSSATGGQINLSTLTGLSSNGATSSGGAAGNITLVAFNGSGASAGSINTNGVGGGGVSAKGGNSNGPNGNITYIAGATTGVGINAGNVTTGGVLQGNQGTITFVTATPAFTSNLSITNGIVTGGPLTASTIQPTSITVGNVTTSGAPITIVSGGDTNIGGTLTTGGVKTAGLVGSNGGNLAIFAGGNINSSVASSGINTNGGTQSNGGNVLLVSGAALTPTLTYTFGAVSPVNFSTTITGATSGGGNIDLTGGGTNNMSTFSTQGNSAAPGFGGGTVQLIGLAGTVTTTTGTVTTPSTLTVTSGGSSNAGNVSSSNQNTNGNVTILAGASSGTAISVGNFNTTGSNAGAGNITIATSQATGAPLVYTNGKVASGTLSASTLQASNAVVGTLTAAGGSVLLPALSGGTFTTQTTTVDVQSGGTLSIGSVTNSNNALPAGNLPGSCTGCPGTSSSTINLLSTGTMTFVGTPTISSSAVAPNPVALEGVNGGTVNITAAGFSGAATVAADATNGYITTNAQGGNGGTISITTTGANNIQVGAGNFTISAKSDTTGGNGGAVTLTSGQDILLDPTMLTAGPLSGTNNQFNPNNGGLAIQVGGNGALLNFVAARNLSTTGALSANGAASTISGSSGNPSGNGGVINITVNSSTVFDIGAAGATTNGIQGLLSANGNVGTTPAFGSGGTINVTNSGTGGVQVETGMLQVAAAPAASAVVGSTTYNAGVGGNIGLTGNTVLALGPLNVNGGGSSALTGSGTAGSISITATGSAAFVIGTPTTNGVTTSITANGNVVGSGSPPAGPASGAPVPPFGSGGTITINNSGGDINIDNTGTLSVLAAQGNSKFSGGNGGNIILNAPSGQVFSAGSLAANGGNPSTASSSDTGNGGSIVITTGSANQFMVGSPTTNGITGTISATGYNGGTISISSTGAGGIQITSNSLVVTPTSQVSSTQAGGNGGSLTINASGGPVAINGALNVTGAGTSTTAPTGFNLAGNGGSITITSNSATVLTLGSVAGSNYIQGPLTSNGGIGIAGNGDAGSISVTNSGGDISVGSGSIVLTPGNATQSGYAGNGGNLTLAAPSGNITVTGSLSVNAGNGFIPSGNTPIFSQGFAGSINISLNSSSNFNIGGASVTQLSAAGWNGGTISVTNNGSGGVTVSSNTAINVAAQAANPNVAISANLQVGQRNLGGPGGNVTLSSSTGPVTTNGNVSVIGGAIFAQTASGSVPSGTTVITLSSTQGFAVGEQVTISASGVQETQTISKVTSTQITVGSLTNSYTSPTISTFSNTTNATAIPTTNNTTGLTVINVNSSSGFIVGQPVLISTGSSNQEIQFISAVATGTITVGQLQNTYASNPSVTAFSTPGTITASGGSGVQGTGTLTAGTLNLTSSGGTIGSAGTPLLTNLLSGSSTGTVSVNSSGLTNLQNSSLNSALGTIQTGGAFTFVSNGGINLAGTFNSGGAATVQNTNTSSGNILVSNVNGAANLITANGPILFQNANPNGNITVNNGNSLVSTNNAITLLTKNPVISGANSINAGSGTFTLAPLNNSDVINLVGGTGGFNITAAQLSSINAATLIIGSNTGTGGINLNGALNLTSLYNLQLLQGPTGAFTGTGQTLTLGSKNLTINVGGTVNLPTIASSGSVIQVTGGSIVANAAVGSATDTTTFTASSGNISGAGLITAQTLNAVASANITLNTAISNLQLSTTSGNAGVTNTGSMTLQSATVGGTLTLSASGTMNLGTGSALTLSSGGNMTLTSSGNSINGVIITDNTAINAGALVGSPAFGNLTSAQIQKAGGISITSFGSGGILFGNATSLTSNGGDIGLNINKTGASVNTGVSGINISLVANAGNINVFSLGQANIGVNVGTSTTMKAGTLNTFQGGNISINANGGIRIGGTATVTALNNLSLLASSGAIDIAASGGSTIQVGSAVGASNVGGITNILAGGTGLKFGANTNFTSNATVSVTTIGTTSGLTLGNNVTLTSGQLSGPGVVKTNGGLFITVTGSAGIVGGTNDSIVVEGLGGGIGLQAVGVGAPITLGDQAKLQADGGPINLFAAGAISLGAVGGTKAPGLVTTTIGGAGGPVIITASNGLTLGDNMQNTIVGGLILNNTAGTNNLSIGAGSSTTVTGFANLGQFASGGELFFGNNATFKASGFMSVTALGVKTGKTVELGTTVDFESTGSGMNISASGNGTFTAGDGTIIKSGNGGINIFASGAMTLGTVTGVNIQSTGVAGQIGINAGSFTLAGASTLNSSAGLNIFGQSSTGVVTFGAGSATTANGFASIGGLGSTISAGLGATFTINGPGLNINESNSTGNITFADGQIQVTNGNLFVFSLGNATFGSGATGSKLTTTGAFTQISITGMGSTAINANSLLNAGGLINISNLGSATGTLSVGNSATFNAANGGITFGNFNSKADTQFGNGVTMTASSATVGSINISGTGVSGTGNTISFGTGSNLTANNVVGISINSFNPTGTVTIGDNFSLKANGSGSVTVSNLANGVANSLAIGISGGNPAGVLQAGNSVNITSQGGLSLGAGAFTATNSTFNASTLFGAVTVSNSIIQAGTNATISSSTGTTINNSAQVSANNNLTVSATSPTVAAAVTLGNSVQLAAGKLQGVIPVPPILLPANIKSAGTLTISSGLGNLSHVTIGNTVTLTSAGNNLNVTANNGNLTIGTGGNFTANGGNLVMLAKGTVTGGSGNTFTANTVGANAVSSTGGGLEIGSGLTNSANTITALNQPPNPAFTPGSLGTGVTPSNVGGTVQVNKTGGGVINLNSVATPSTLNLNKGVQIFDAQGAGSSVQMDGATFQTNALKPIALITPVDAAEIDAQSLASLPVSIKKLKAGNSAISVGSHGAELHTFNTKNGGATIVPSEESAKTTGKQVARIIARPKAQFAHSEQGNLHLASGELFLNATSQLKVSTDDAEVQVQKGALVSVRAEDGCTYVRVCSSSGTVKVNVIGKILTLNSGEELVVSNHKPDNSEIRPADGLGRRNTHTVALGNKYVTVSDFSIVSMVSNHETLYALHNSGQNQDRQLIDRMLKTAATVDMVLRYRGAYSAAK